MELEQPTHLLTKFGILSSFSISQKITEDDVAAMLKKLKTKVKSEEDILDLIKYTVSKEILSATKKGEIPGLLLNDLNITKGIPIKNVEFLNKLVDGVLKKLKHLDKPSLCYYITCLVNLLNLDESDFEEFNNRMDENE